MARLDLYLKVEMDVDGEESADKLAGEICRQIMKLYGVRNAELVNYIRSE